MLVCEVKSRSYKSKILTFKVDGLFTIGCFPIEGKYACEWDALSQGLVSNRLSKYTSIDVTKGMVKFVTCIDTDNYMTFYTPLKVCEEAFKQAYHLCLQAKEEAQCIIDYNPDFLPFEHWIKNVAQKILESPSMYMWYWLDYSVSIQSCKMADEATFSVTDISISIRDGYTEVILTRNKEGVFEQTEGCIACSEDQDVITNVLTALNTLKDLPLSLGV